MYSRSTNVLAILAAVMLSGNLAAQAGAGGAQGPRTLPLLTAMSAEEQTRLALTAAAPEVTSKASIYVLDAKGYTRTRSGTNGFSCIIEREFPETVEPVCYDAEGSATLLHARIYREELRLKGLSEDAVGREVAAGFKSGRFHAPRKPGMVYMLSREGWAWHPILKKFWAPPPHYMLYAPYARQEDFGGPGGPQIPYIQWAGQPDALIIIMSPEMQSH